jgi:hypothetical protein
MKTPAARAVKWAKDHGRPMDSTVILAWEAGYNARCRDHQREVRRETKRTRDTAEKFEDFMQGKAAAPGSADNRHREPYTLVRVVKTSDPLARFELMKDWPKGCAPPTGYVEWHNWAEAQDGHGLKQERCSRCKLWFFPQEAPSHINCTT